MVAYGLILPPPVLALPRLGCVNIHGSLLPRWRGAAPIQRAILAGDAETGVTIMQLDAGLDTGPMLLERARPIGSHDTAGDLHDALSELGAAALIEALDGLAAGTLTPRAQPAEGASYAPKIDKSEAPLDWIAERHRARSADSRLQSLADRRNAVRQAKPCACCAHGSPSPQAPMPRPGTLLGIADDGLRVACGEGVLAVRELQRAGKRPVSARDFANAVRLAGLRFGA